MDAPGDFDQFDGPEDEFDEVDLSEEEFDARMATGEPVLVVGFAARPRLRERVEDYYTLQMSDSRIVTTSAGRWGGSEPPADRHTPLVSQRE